MRTTILTDNTALFDRMFVAEHGFSAYIEAEGKRILFDTGYSGAFLQNAGKMQIDLFDLDYIVLSHGHFDHTGGLWYGGSLKRQSRKTPAGFPGSSRTPAVFSPAQTPLSPTSEPCLPQK